MVLFGWLGPQDPVYGFDPDSVVAALTTKNWKRKAVFRQDRHGLLYVWITKGKEEEAGKIVVVYRVSVKRMEGEGGRDYDRDFYALEPALRYANGKDRSAYSRYTRPMGRMILNEEGAQFLGGRPGADGYACFLTKVVESILAVDPAISKYVYEHGISLHPDVEGRKSYGPKSNLPARITVRCYKSKDKVVASFHLFPKERAARGRMRVVPVEEHIRKSGIAAPT